MKLKSWIKYRLDFGKYKSKEYYEKIIKNYDYVSFDLFDTLIKRYFKIPTDLFKYMEKELNIPGFASKRIEAEKIAREKKGEKEIDLLDIYNEIETDIDKKRTLANKEMEFELDNIVFNGPIKELYNYCLENNKKIIILTDTYFDENFIKKILIKVGYENYYKLFVSSSIGVTKSNGKVYNYLLNKLNINSKEIIHIGDSKKSDNINANKVGIASINIPTNVSTLSINDRKLDYFISYSNSETDYYKKVGYNNFGPLLLGYSNWILSNLEKNKINNVYFFSRDGYIMKQAFDLVNKNKNIKSHYLEVSRRSLKVPVLWMNTELGNVIDFMFTSKTITIKSFFETIGLNVKKYKKILTKYALTEESIFECKKVLNNNIFNDMYAEIKKDVEENSKIEFSALKAYIDKNNLKGKFAIVDIGWSGSMQRSLETTLNYLNIENDIFGFYIGVEEGYKKNIVGNKERKMYGYLFDFKNKTNQYDCRRGFVGLFETLFLENGGSVKKYLLKGNEVIVERYDYEYIKDGKPTEELLKVKLIQESAINFIKNILQVNNVNFENIKSANIFSGLRRIGLNPNKEDIEKFGYFNFLDNGIENKLVSHRSIWYYILHIKNMKSDFLNSRWKVGFLKDTFKIKLPYEKIYNLLQRFK